MLYFLKDEVKIAMQLHCMVTRRQMQHTGTHILGMFPMLPMLPIVSIGCIYQYGPYTVFGRAVQRDPREPVVMR